MRTDWKYHAALFLGAMIWGFAFVAQRAASSMIETFFFNSARYLIGAACLFPLALCRRADLKDPKLWKLGFALALCLFAAGYFQQEALTTTSSGKAGFITSLYIIFVPLCQVFFGRRIGVRLWLAVGLALSGLYLISVQQAGGGFGKAEAMVLLAAVFFTLHILLVERYAGELDAAAVSGLQFLLSGLMSLAVALSIRSVDFAALRATVFPTFYAGALSCGVAYTLQIYGQKGSAASVASLIMSFEAVFAAVGGALLLGERLSGRELTGCALMLFAVLLAQLPGRREGTAVSGSKEELKA